jgi:hypothetical protein
MEDRMNIKTTNQKTTRPLIQSAEHGTAQEFKEALAKDGTAILDNALDTFFKVDREVSDGRNALDGLSELKRALHTRIERDKDETTTNLQNARTRLERLESGQDPEYALRDAEIEKLQNIEPRFGRQYDNRKYLNKGLIGSGELRWERESAKVVKPTDLPPNGMSRFVKDLVGVQALFAAVAMVPGPMSASVKSVVKQTLTRESRYSSRESHEESASAVGLLPLGLYGSQSSGQSTASGHSSTRAETSTVDERVVPVLLDLKERLLQASVEPPTSGQIIANREGEEYVKHETWLGKTRDIPLMGFSGWDRPREVLTFDFNPERIALPLDETSNLPR